MRKHRKNSNKSPRGIFETDVSRLDHGHSFTKLFDKFSNLEQKVLRVGNFRCRKQFAFDRRFENRWTLCILKNKSTKNQIKNSFQTKFCQKMSDVQLHYNRRAAETQQQRQESVIFGLKKLNNLLKRALIAEAMSKLSNTAKPLYVVDLCGGKAGDLQKYIQNCKIASRKLFYLLIDNSEQEVQRAKQRFSKLPPNDRAVVQEAHFVLANVSTWHKNTDLHDKYRNYESSCDIVSCQFALHYICDTRENHAILWNIVNWFSKPSSLFIASFPSRSRVLQWRDANVTNELCKIQFVSKNRYLFSLSGAIQDCPENLMPTTRDLHKMAETVSDMHCIMQANCEEMLKKKQNVVDSGAARTALMEACFTTLSDLEFHVACLYQYVIFERRPDTVSSAKIETPTVEKKIDSKSASESRVEKSVEPKHPAEPEPAENEKQTDVEKLDNKSPATRKRKQSPVPVRRKSSRIRERSAKKLKK